MYSVLPLLSLKDRSGFVFALKKKARPRDVTGRTIWIRERLYFVFLSFFICLFSFPSRFSIYQYTAAAFRWILPGRLRFLSAGSGIPRKN